jgi:hypothetical protein
MSYTSLELKAKVPPALSRNLYFVNTCPNGKLVREFLEVMNSALTRKVVIRTVHFAPSGSCAGTYPNQRGTDI